MGFFEDTIQQSYAAGGPGTLFDLANPKWDAVVFVFLIITTLFYGLGLKRGKILSLLFSTYITIAIVNNLQFIGSWLDVTKLNSEFNILFALISLLVFVVTFIFVHIAIGSYFSKDKGKDFIMQNFFLSFLHVSLIVSIVLSSFPPEVIAVFTPFTQRFFISNIARIVWFVLPILTIILFKKDRSLRPKPRESQMDDSEMRISNA